MTRDKGVTSMKLEELQNGDLVEIVETRPLQKEQCSRGKLAEGGWINILDLQTEEVSRSR